MNRTKLRPIIQKKIIVMYSRVNHNVPLMLSRLLFTATFHSQNLPAPPIPSGKGVVPVKNRTTWLMESASGTLNTNCVSPTCCISVCTCQWEKSIKSIIYSRNCFFFNKACAMHWIYYNSGITILCYNWQLSWLNIFFKYNEIDLHCLA